MPADGIRRTDETAPHRSRRSLRHALELKRLPSLGRSGADACSHLRDQFGRQMPAQFSRDSAGMNGSCADAAAFELVVERHCVKNIRRFRTAICGKRLVGSLLEIWIFEINVADLMTRRRQRADSSTALPRGHPPLKDK